MNEKTRPKTSEKIMDGSLYFIFIVPNFPTYTDLISVKTLEPNISSLGPFNMDFLKPYFRFPSRNSEVDPQKMPPHYNKSPRQTSVLIGDNKIRKIIYKFLTSPNARVDYLKGYLM